LGPRVGTGHGTSRHWALIGQRVVWVRASQCPGQLVRVCRRRWPLDNTVIISTSLYRVHIVFIAIHVSINWNNRVGSVKRTH